MIGFLLRNSRWVLIVSVLAGLGSGLSGAGLVAAINLALTNTALINTELAGVFVGLCVMLFTARSLSSLLLMRLGQNVIFDLRVKLSRQILSAPYPRLQALGPAKILACLTQDVATLAEAFRWLPMLCVNGAIVAGCLLYLGWLSEIMLALVAVAMLVGVSGFRLVETQAFRGLKRARDCDDLLYGHFRSLTHGIKELKLHQARRNAFLSEYLESSANGYRRHYVYGMGLYVIASNLGNVLFYAVIGIVLFVLPLYWTIAPDVLRGYCLAILYMMSPLEALLDGIPIVNRGKIALQKIQAMGREPAEQPACKQMPDFVFPSPKVLQMRGVTHHYRSETAEQGFMLGPIDLTLNPGELVFLVGGNGSGKTTLSLLLVGLYAPDQGEISLGGVKITQTLREAYRQQFSTVFADAYLFDSLLGLGGDALHEDVREYLLQLQLAHKVSIENGGFSTLNLSQGQRKRLALLVAYLEDRPFYVFDEWAADQDPVFRKLFYTEILPTLKAKGKTVVVISHDESYFHLADRCLLLADGKFNG